MPDNQIQVPQASLIRFMMADYINLGDPESPKWSLMGDGFTAIDENPNAQTENIAYVNNRTASTLTTGYQVTFPFSTRLFVEQEATMKIYHVATSHALGVEGMAQYLRVDLFKNPLDPNIAEYGENEYRARLFIVSVAVSSISGEGTSAIVVDGDLNVQGDFVLGKFNIFTREFTPLARQGAGRLIAGLEAAMAVNKAMEDAKANKSAQNPGQGLAAANAKKEAKTNEKD